MKTKKKPVRRKLGVTTAGEVFGRMLKEAKFFEYMVFGPDENPWDEDFIGLCDVDDSISVDGHVAVYDVIRCGLNAPVSIKGDTVEYKDPSNGYTYLFRFYGAPPRIETLT